MATNDELNFHAQQQQQSQQQFQVPHQQPAQLTQGSPARSPASRSASFNNRSESSLSIVFNAAWVRLTAPIGEGAFSRVYEGVYTHPETRRESVVAVKILKRNMLKRRSDCLRFIKEAKIMTKICHRHITECYGIGKYDDDDPHNPGCLFIVQELVRGGNLLHKVYKQMLNRAKCVYTSAEALQWMMDVAQGMQYLHEVSSCKPMIIHRDLKLENIMLAPERLPGGAGTTTVAKLVDFGLHKVIDDRLKKVVKRVISEAHLGAGGLGGRMARARAAGEDEFDPDDELEAALAEQRALVEASSVRPGVGAAALSPLGASPVPKLRASPLRMTSRMQIIERPGSLMGSQIEEEDEEDAAIRAAQAETAAREAAAAQQLPGMPAPSAAVLSVQAQHAAVVAARRSPLSRSTSQGQRNSNGGGQQHTGDGSPAAGSSSPAAANPDVQRVRAPPKKQSSMQKLMAKMKEIKLKVTGKAGKEGGAGGGSPGHKSDGATSAGSSSPPAAATPRTSSLSHATGPDLAATSPTHAAHAAAAGAAAAAGGTQASADAAHAARIARNTELLNRLVAQQSTAAAAERTAVSMDDSGVGLGGGGGAGMAGGLADGPARARLRPPPRRAVTWVNDVRYNLTEAVGSWAYMAPEVVLGQPYNEKVDVFSFGVILFEVLNRKLMLVDEIKNDPRKDAQAYAERVARGFRPEVPRNWPSLLVDTIKACWSQDPHLRPNFTAVVDLLGELQAGGEVAQMDASFWSTTSAFV